MTMTPAERARLAKAEALIDQLLRITAAWTRGIYAARIDCWRGDAKAAGECLSEALDGYDGPEWDGAETGAEWWERTKADEPDIPGPGCEPANWSTQPEVTA